ncbi:MAG TPA: NlpC/P60 family protein [Thermodesulfobacteriota bacterium]|jgi:LysM repeat protein|nr:NlpC/P60 family protein [Thermodesulfobacteriota bacterium]
MIRLLKILGMELIFLLLLFGFYQKGWTEERYTVKPGDTLYGISKSLGVSVETLKKANALEEESIKPKQVLTIPSRGGNKAANVAGKRPSRASKKLSDGTVKSALGETDSYVVQKGDSLNSISEKVGLSTKEIMMRNGLHTSGLKIGQILVLRRDGSRLDEETEELGDEKEMAGSSQAEGEKGEPVASVPLGKWSNPEERGLLVRVAKAFLGVPYKLGGSTLKGIDCSALVKKIYEVFNIQLPRTAREQFTVGKRVEKDQLEEGDLVFFRRAGNRAHVGIYVGDNQFIHASFSSREVRIDHLNAPYYSERFLRGVRVMELKREI